ncbi:MAG TPA: hypothetical protein VKV26_20520 [Dehalococcoidia bacterium]|nr:hypothetical protein [Dehalococcoidia bacterium]
MSLFDKAKDAVDRLAHQAAPAKPRADQPPPASSAADASAPIHKAVNLKLWLTVEGDQPPAADFSALAQAAVRSALGSGATADGTAVTFQVLSVEETSETPDEADMSHA